MPITASIQDGIGRLILDSPPLNILTRDMLAELRQRLSELADSRELRVVILYSNGPHFSAGADVGEHLPPHHEDLIPEFIETVQALAAFPLPVVAAVRGRCLGGGFELAQAADVIVTGESATFGQPEIRLGVFPPAACALLPQLIGPGAAAELLFTGEVLSAREAASLGLVRRVVPDDQVESAAWELGERIARNSPAALRLTKRALRARSESAYQQAMSRAGTIYLDELMATADAVEGLQAFMQKREPEWKGR